MTEQKTYRGIVIEFDEHRGLGVIEIEHTKQYQNKLIDFHCVNIADGSRTIDIGTPVSFNVYRHPIGGYQACKIVKN